MQYPGAVLQKSISLNGISGRSHEKLDWAVQRSPEDLLIERTQNGDLAAFNELVLIHQDIVYRTALWILKEQEAAEDAAQESFLKAYRKIHTFLPGKPFRSWLLRITTNQCLDMIRAARRCPSQPLVQTGPDGEEMETFWIKDPADSPEQIIERAEVERKIARAIQGLSPEYRTVVILVDLQELDYAEASTILEIPLGTMKSRLSRARHLLRKALR